MLMDSRETEWYASMLQILGSDKGLRLMRGLAKQDLSFRPGRTLDYSGPECGRSAAGGQ